MQGLELNAQKTEQKYSLLKNYIYTHIQSQIMLFTIIQTKTQI